MYCLRLTRLALLLITLTCLDQSALAQALITSGLKLMTKAQGSGEVVVGVNSGGTSSNQILVLPGTSGSLNQILTISSLSDNTANLAWTTPITGTVDVSVRLATQQADTRAYTTGITFTSVANKKYQFIAYLIMTRSGATEDDFYVAFVPPSGASSSFGVECLNCPAGTAPGYVYQSTSTTSAVLMDPAGNSPGTYRYVLFGILNVGATGGDFLLSFNKKGGSATTTMEPDSYIIAREIP